MKIKFHNYTLWGWIIIMIGLFPQSSQGADSFFDKNNNLRINDQPFFPIGMYNVYPPNAFEELKEAGFNTAHIYNVRKKYLREYLKKAEKSGIKVLMHPATYMKGKFYNLDRVADAVKEFKNSSALLAWYLVDEPGYQQINPVEVGQLYEKIKKNDLTHSSALVIASLKNFKKYSSYTDIMMIDPYPVPRNPLTQVSDSIKKARKAVKDKKPVWAIVQAYGYQNHRYKGWGKEREPTFEEERCMTYLAIVHGAKGIFYYTYHGSQYKIQLSKEHWKGLKRIAGELRTLTPILLSEESADKVQMKIRGKITKDNNGDPAIHFLLKEFKGRKYLIAVNVIKRLIEVSFDGFQGDASEFDVMFEGRKVLITGGKFIDSFTPYAVHIYVAQENGNVEGH